MWSSSASPAREAVVTICSSATVCVSIQGKRRLDLGIVASRSEDHVVLTRRVAARTKASTTLARLGGDGMSARVIAVACVGPQFRGVVS